MTDGTLLRVETRLDQTDFAVRLPGPVPHAAAVGNGAEPVFARRPAGGRAQRAFDARVVSRPGLVPGGSGPDGFPGTVFLRLDLPSGHAPSFLWKPALGAETRPAALGIEPLQELPEAEILRADRGPGRGGAGLGDPGPARPGIARHPLFLAGGVSGTELRVRACRGDRPCQPEAAALPPGAPDGRGVHYAAGAESARDALVVPRAVPAGSAAGRGGALVRGAPGKERRAVRRLKPVPAALPGRRRSHPRRALAQGRVPSVPELRGGLPGRRPGIPFQPGQKRARIGRGSGPEPPPRAHRP